MVESPEVGTEDDEKRFYVMQRLRFYCNIETVLCQTFFLLLLISQLLIDKWAYVSNRRMSSNAVIVDFKILKECSPGLFMRWIDRVSHTFFFERSEETLHRSVVPTIAFARHTDPRCHLLKPFSRLLGWCIDLRDHCDATAPLWDGDETEPYSKRFPLTARRSSPTWTIPQPLSNTSPRSQQDRAILVL